ncbi:MULTISPECIES: hypothetical protein [unclassified Sphingomonas]|uniref:hypothetical protein n=1 Tax=unclassified Sphingomonas TaxID=196159 RepID=UPI002151CBF2|nr:MULTISPECIES: hypothetical protein [unclassified Sphingomonas]MCR5870673.1 hypothetical protein [Sphingomonas sp. J344]UUY00991.1 hypothetical protein LRS08_08025 [Sphingomonas sp. J315]
MANVTSYRNDTIPQLSRGLSVISKSVTLAADAADNADTIEIFTVPVGENFRLFDASLKVGGTLGASCTVQLRANRGGTRTVLTAATTAGGASKVTGAAQTTVPFDLASGDIIELLVGGADIAASAAVEVDLKVSRR